MRNTLYYGDNLPVLREYIAAESIDLVYLDPPFNSNRSYNVLYKHESGASSEAQEKAFSDTWHWNEKAQETYADIIAYASADVAKMIGTFVDLLDTNQMTAYLVMMTARLVELHRVLKPTGSLYLHCDPTASHYLKIVLDTIFGPENFRNEIIWKRTNTHNDAKTKFPDVSDTILFYAKSKATQFHPQLAAHDERYVKDFYKYDDNDGRGLYQLADMASPNPRPNMMYTWMGFPPPTMGWRYQTSTMQELHDQGRIYYPRSADGEFDTSRRPRLKRYLKEQKGTVIGNVWADIDPLSAHAAERLGYPTQKPEALLERIIRASSNEGDLVLDPFCGCGTAIAAAERLGRRWIGMDVTSIATAHQKNRLLTGFNLEAHQDYDVIGEPADVASAQQLAQDDPYQFQWWAVGLVGGRPAGGDGSSKAGKKGADKGIDGVIYFTDDGTNKLKQVIIQVKAGKVHATAVRDLRGVLDRDKAAIGVLITMDKPTSAMVTEAAKGGYYDSPWYGKFPRLQLLTVEELLHKSKSLLIPPRTNVTLKQAPKARSDATHGQLGMELNE